MAAGKSQADAGSGSATVSEKFRVRALAGQYGLSVEQAWELVARHGKDEGTLKQKAAKLKADQNAAQK